MTLDILNFPPKKEGDLALAESLRSIAERYKLIGSGAVDAVLVREGERDANQLIQAHFDSRSLQEPNTTRIMKLINAVSELEPEEYRDAYRAGASMGLSRFLDPGLIVEEHGEYSHIG